MRPKLAYIFLMTILGLFAVTSLEAQTPLFRLTANFDGAAEKFTNTPPLAAGAGGLTIFTKGVFQPPGKNTLFVTFSGTGDTHFGSTLAMSCTIDGVLCGGLGGGPIGACASFPGAPSGWICLNHMADGGTNASCNNGGGGPGDCHDNNINQTWCLTASPGAHNVVLKIASVQNPATGISDNVFIEGAKYYIDSTTFTDGNPDACTLNP